MVPCCTHTVASSGAGEGRQSESQPRSNKGVYHVLAEKIP